jgi:type III restriction enzyme
MNGDASGFMTNPILNSPYEPPDAHHDLSGSKSDTSWGEVKTGRRLSQLATVAVPRTSSPSQSLGDLFETGEDTHTLINRIRQDVAAWRNLPTARQWQVTPTTEKLLKHWRSLDPHETIRPFFCQMEAVETAIWLYEVARNDKRFAYALRGVRDGNAGANPEILRLALKLATGAGKTTVMSMLIAWQALNAARNPNSKLFTRSFLVIAPGITIKDRLRVLEPEGVDSYYAARNIVPRDMLPDLGRAKISITNYHAFQRRNKLSLSKGNKAALAGWRDEGIDTLESEGEMLRRAMPELVGMSKIFVINDEAHHCYRENPESKERKKREEKDANEAARLWINGIGAVQRHMGLLGQPAKTKATSKSLPGVIDLSATPYFLKGSGYPEGLLFPWTVSDFPLIEAIECGIVKLPRVPILDNHPSVDDKPILGNLWKHVGKKMPKKGRKAGGGGADPADLPELVQTGLKALYDHYVKTSEQWDRAGIGVPPVFIVVCNNTASSQMVHDWIAGWEREETAERPSDFAKANLAMFSNFDTHDQRLSKPRTFLIDSAQFDNPDAIKDAFRKEMSDEIEQFRREFPNKDITDETLLREVMNTIGQKGRLGESIRCVVSVSMLTEGWDANTVTHVFGLRAFGSQLISEQVMGRGLRRISYDLDENNRFRPEYADILGIPFDFIGEPTASTITPPRKPVQVRAVRERTAAEITFPNVVGYRTELPLRKVEADFNVDSRLTITREMVGPTETVLSGIVGETAIIRPNEKDYSLSRPSTLIMKLSGELVRAKYPTVDGEFDMRLFNRVRPVVKAWLDDYLICGDGTFSGMLEIRALANRAVEKIHAAIERANQRRAGAGEAAPVVRAIIDPINATGSSRFVGFPTTKPVLATDMGGLGGTPKCQIDHIVLDSGWEKTMAMALQKHPRVLAYVKNQGLGFAIPYRKGTQPHDYIPDFIVRVEVGADEPLNLIVEVKGKRDDDAAIKADTAKTLWVPSVNNDGRFGRWTFHEFTDVWMMETELDAQVNAMISKIMEPTS